MAEEDRPYYSGFDELAKKLFPDVELASNYGDDGPKSPDIVEELRRVRVDAMHYPGMVRHKYPASPQLDGVAVEAASRAGDLLHQARVTERWPVDVHPELTARIGDCREILSVVAPDVEYEVEHPAVFKFAVEPQEFPKLPAGYAFKGGVARKALARAMRLNIQTHRVRDMDIVKLGRERSPELEEELAKAYMQDDWVFAKKVPIEMQPNCKAYFKTREFGMNQVILHGATVMCTALCLCDFISGTIRPTHNHLKRHRGHVDGIVAAKAIRFLAEGKCEGRAMRLDQDAIRVRRCIRHFHLAIHLARALEHDEEVALEFLKECVARRLTRLSFDGTINDAVRRLCKVARLEPSFFESRDTDDS